MHTIELLADKQELTELLNSYFHGFDRRRTDAAFFVGHFSEDAWLNFPAGGHTGLSGFPEVHEKILNLWGETLHTLTNHTFTVDGDRASGHAVLNATHVHRDDDPGTPMFLGAHVPVEAVRTPHGWRMSRLAIDLVWTAGDGPSG